MLSWSIRKLRQPWEFKASLESYNDRPSREMVLSSTDYEASDESEEH